MMDSLKNRKSIRRYASRPVDDALLDELLATAERASTTGNMQLYSVVVTRSAEGKQRLAPCHFNQPMITQAPVVLTFCADYNRFSKWCEQRNAVPGYANFHSFLTAMIDTLLFAEHFCVAAEKKGLGICYLGTTTYSADKLVDILGLPKLVMPVTTVTVGYPDENPSQPDRLPLTGIVHREAYADYTPESIDAVFGYRESLDENRRFVEINGKETLAQVFTDIRYTRRDNEAISEMLKELLVKQGFC